MGSPRPGCKVGWLQGTTKCHGDPALHSLGSILSCWLIPSFPSGTWVTAHPLPGSRAKPVSPESIFSLKVRIGGLSQAL